MACSSNLYWYITIRRNLAIPCHHSESQPFGIKTQIWIMSYECYKPKPVTCKKWVRPLFYKLDDICVKNKWQHILSISHTTNVSVITGHICQFDHTITVTPRSKPEVSCDGDGGGGGRDFTFLSVLNAQITNIANSKSIQCIITYRL